MQPFPISLFLIKLFGPIIESSLILVFPIRIVPGKIFVFLPIITSGEIKTPSLDINSTPSSINLSIIFFLLSHLFLKVQICH